MLVLVDFLAGIVDDSRLDDAVIQYFPRDDYQTVSIS